MKEHVRIIRDHGKQERDQWILMQKILISGFHVAVAMSAKF